VAPAAAPAATGPAAGNGHASPPGAADPAADPAAQRPLRILLVEDSPDNRALIQFYLKREPCRLDVAENGQRGVEQFTVGDYDLVLMDMQMPVMDGAAATRAIRAWERAHHRPPTPVLALTANVLAADVQACLDAGCTSHIAKPVKKPVLLEAIARHAARCSSSESLAASQTARSTAA
jgi:CheY-like chemotaxis protein